VLNQAKSATVEAPTFYFPYRLRYQSCYPTPWESVLSFGLALGLPFFLKKISYIQLAEKKTMHQHYEADMTIKKYRISNIFEARWNQIDSLKWIGGHISLPLSNHLSRIHGTCNNARLRQQWFLGEAFQLLLNNKCKEQRNGNIRPEITADLPSYPIKEHKHSSGNSVWQLAAPDRLPSCPPVPCWDSTTNFRLATCLNLKRSATAAVRLIRHSHQSTVSAWACMVFSVGQIRLLHKLKQVEGQCDLMEIFAKF
jgi:hypothetical protein